MDNVRIVGNELSPVDIAQNLKIIKNKNYVPKIYKEEIRLIKYDYELQLDDLEDMDIQYDLLTHKLFVYFKPVYVCTLEELIKIDCVIVELSGYCKFNGRYENAREHLAHQVTLSKEAQKYLQDKLKEILEERLKKYGKY